MLFTKIQRLFISRNGEHSKKRICLLCDRPNWAYHYRAVELVNQLSDEFCFDIKYVVDSPRIRSKDYDLLMVFFWGEQSYKKWHFPKNKILKQVTSHRWQDNPMYGPCTPKQFVKKYLGDAKAISCPSQILYGLISPYCKNIYLCGEGYNPSLFYYKHERTGTISICSAGNLKDPVKGIEDILKPAAKEYDLNLASDLPHEELVNFYNRHDIYVVSSVHEANPQPLIESMACGCFPVSSYVGIAPELIRHKENGYLVKNRTVDEFKEAFEWCNENLDYIRQQGKKNAEEMFEKRRWEVMAENYRKMIKEQI